MSPHVQSFLEKWKRVSLPNKLTVVCTFIIAIATSLYSAFAYRQWCSMKGQLDVMQRQLQQLEKTSVQTDSLIAATNKLAEAGSKQADTSRLQVVGTQGTVLEARFDLTDRGLSVGIDKPVGTVMPEMRVMAKNVDIDLVVTVKRVADRKIIGTPIAFRRHFQVMQRRYDETIPFPDYTRQVYEATCTRLERLITIKGRFSYDNGFGGLIKEDICLGYFGYATKGFSAGGFFSCDLVDGYLGNAIKRKQEDEAKTTEERQRK